MCSKQDRSSCMTSMCRAGPRGQGQLFSPVVEHGTRVTASDASGMEDLSLQASGSNRLSGRALEFGNCSGTHRHPLPAGGRSQSPLHPSLKWGRPAEGAAIKGPWVLTPFPQLSMHAWGQLHLHHIRQMMMGLGVIGQFTCLRENLKTAVNWLWQANMTFRKTGISLWVDDYISTDWGQAVLHAQR